jgi:hypothetical protein
VLLGEGEAAAVSGIDVEPQPVLGRHVGQLVQRIDDARRGRAGRGRHTAGRVPFPQIFLDLYA